MRVLIAGGDTEFLELEQRFLSHCGHDATIAYDGLECASILQDFIPDVVVIDCELLWGGSDGVVAIMLEDPRLSQTPVIFVADVDPREAYEDKMEWMVVDWIRKPYGMRELLTQITNHVQSCRLQNRGYATPKLTAYQGVGQ